MRFNNGLPVVLISTAAVLAVLTVLNPTIEHRAFIPATDSVQWDIYLSAEEPTRAGDYVLVEVPAEAADFARTRGYYAGPSQWIKRYRAGSGDHVCIRNGELAINDTFAGRVFTTDRKGRPLPVQTICRHLAEGEVFITGDTDYSFDSRYFGPVRQEAIRRHLIPLIGSFFTEQ